MAFTWRAAARARSWHTRARHKHRPDVRRSRRRDFWKCLRYARTALQAKVTSALNTFSSRGACEPVFAQGLLGSGMVLARSPNPRVARLVACRGGVHRPHRRAHLVDLSSAVKRGSWAVRRVVYERVECEEDLNCRIGRSLACREFSFANIRCSDWLHTMH